jgi:hypothetical protein
MKLKNLLIASAGLFLFGACSSSENEPEVVNKSFDAVLSIAATQNGVTTKADATDANALTNEAFISTLTAYVFNEAGTLVGSGISTSAQNGNASVDSVAHITVKVNAQDAGYVSTDKFDVFLLANATPSTAITSESQLSEALLNGDITSISVPNVKSGKAYIPMFSKVIKGVTGLVAGKTYNNWALNSKTTVQTTTYTGEYEVTTTAGKAGAATTTVYSMNSEDKILLNRYVARVQLESLKTNFEGTLANSEFTLTNVSLANVSGTSLLMPSTASTAISGFELMPATISYFRGYPATITRADYILANGSTSDLLSKSYTGVTVNNTTPVTFDNTNMAQFYAFEHSSSTFTENSKTGTAYTLMIITGDIKDASTGITQKDVSYRVVIKDNTVTGVKHNYIYKLNVTLTGTGTPNPDENLLNAYLSVKITVDPWKVVNQTENDVN